VERILNFVLITTLVQVALVVIFRLAPGIKGGFLASAIAPIFISPNVLGELHNGAYTIFDPTKAGGFFVNANVGATFMGMSAFIAWGYARATLRHWPYWIVAANLLGTLATGSKAGALLALVLPLLAAAIIIFRAGRISIKLAAILCFLAAGAIPVVVYGLQYFLASRFAIDSGQTFSERLAIWDFAWQVFQRHPFFGLGFGGWEQEWPLYAIARGLNPLFPPHNSLIALFVQSGIVTVILALAFCATFLWQLWSLGGRRDKTGAFAFGLFFSALWAFTQSMGENFGILGESHITALLSLATGYLLYLSENEIEKRID
jgi:O-antigen ligase